MSITCPSASKELGPLLHLESARPSPAHYSPYPASMGNPAPKSRGGRRTTARRAESRERTVGSAIKRVELQRMGHILKAWISPNSFFRSDLPPFRSSSGGTRYLIALNIKARHATVFANVRTESRVTKWIAAHRSVLF